MKWLKKLLKRKPKLARGGLITGWPKTTIKVDNLESICSRQAVEDWVVNAIKDAKRHGRL